MIGFPPRRVCVLVLCMAVAGCSGYARYNRMGPVHEMLPPQPDYCGALALREPTANELRNFTAYAQKTSLAALCRVLINSNEFLFVN